MARLEEDFERARLSERELVMLRYATKLTLEPGAMRRADVQALRDVGFDDADVLAVCETVAYYAYANRVADGLGVALESEVEEAP